LPKLLRATANLPSLKIDNKIFGATPAGLKKQNGIMDFLSARQNFYTEIEQEESQIDLGKAALFIAQEEYPHLDISEYLNALDTMAAEIQERLPKGFYPLKIVQTINTYLYDDLGFRGNKNDYYNPCNSFLNDVIERRLGIPISLSLVYLELAKRIDFPMVGIGMPGHFLIQPQFEGVGIFIDAFNRGEILFEQDCEDLLNRIYQQPVKLQIDNIEPISNRLFLARMLTNLKAIYLTQRQLEKALAVVERLLLLFPDAPHERRDRGLLAYQLGYFQQTIQDLEFYLDLLPHAPDAEALHKLLQQLQ
jgi:regulator of sirC expression with transglutaminase-like and TPR domain